MPPPRSWKIAQESMNSGCGSNPAFGFELTTAQRSLVLAQTRRIVNNALARHAIEDLSKVIG
jgi:hypothetical protein